MTDKIVIFPYIRYFAPWRNYQCIPTLEGRVVDGGPTFATQGDAAVAAMTFYRLAGVPETEKHTAEIMAPKGHEKNAVIKLAQVTAAKKLEIEKVVIEWMSKPAVLQRIEMYRARVDGRPPPVIEPAVPMPTFGDKKKKEGAPVKQGA
jgi:hypothetical protein